MIENVFTFILSAIFVAAMFALQAMFIAGTIWFGFILLSYVF